MADKGLEDVPEGECPHIHDFNTGAAGAQMSVAATLPRSASLKQKTGKRRI
jgi:hypothetical protein